MSTAACYTLAELAGILGGELQGDPSLQIRSLATLMSAGESQLSFFANSRYLQQLRETKAEAVLVSAAHRSDCPVATIVVDDPYLAFARASQLFDWRRPAKPGVHPTAVIAEGVPVPADAEIGAHVVIEADVALGQGVVIGAGSVIGERCVIGDRTRLEANVTLYPNVRLGSDVLVHSAAVLGSDGFGFAPTPLGWEKICQLGGVVVEDRVEIGAGVTIDRGALDDTRIGAGVKLDNQIQIAHNVVIGRDSAIAGCTAVAGSTRIGERCTIAGMTGITGHLEIADGSHVTAMSLVSKSITRPGVYSSGTGLEPHQQWKRNVVRFRQLDELARRVRKLEQAVELYSTEGQKDDGR
ncbi:UDP-3-O-(3-hydroxymyristoyl)glucosamine N-acyltransferase [Marinobacterium sediminicola]|uniref:UDP-3-O-acylglucosamine N-acyltransferase n=1 Tax=Marinobacterium sediminicola TaxID=518898 RepID=A0ABY1S0T9_9GAMM|nr:UDP-3-O-(3-hydroxymyristoyl)glucosamine N-acyltransferase [Marinobacterium sediminicola]ULG69692.1 UDP-3-O-(3-hydroxymyristoyl)glucosamine N-acyltransferase [Marinobacterium sediminicola]SMR74580.1 UDP-3-O-[3-hydroxymyristoyl] glucosamine N-acyltransferase [Marinobacterium sediminicola]